MPASSLKGPRSRWEVKKQARSGPFWAKIVSKRVRDAGDTEDIYIVEDAAGRQEWARRSSLRHRVFVKQCHVGVTGDKKHDR